MKLKSKKPIDAYPEYEGNGWYVDGADSIEEAIEYLKTDYLCNEKLNFVVEDARIARLHKCLDCGMEWEHDGDYCCGECGECRLSKKYKELLFFKKQR